MDTWVTGIGTHRASPRIYLDGLQVIRAGSGFSPGKEYYVKQMKGGGVMLTLHNDGSASVSKPRTVSKKVKNNREVPVIDINSREVLAAFEGMDAVRVVVQQDRIVFLPLASEIKKRERIGRLAQKMAAGEPLLSMSLSHGGGVLTHAIHDGLTKAGVYSELAFANEIREDLMLQAIEHNDAWNEKTGALCMPMQELAGDDWLMSQIPKLEIMEMGLPCSGASKAGKSKRGLTKMEDHPEVGHLVYSALVILSKAQPAALMGLRT